MHLSENKNKMSYMIVHKTNVLDCSSIYIYSYEDSFHGCMLNFFHFVSIKTQDPRLFRSTC